MQSIDWETAYLELEKQVTFMMKETNALLKNNPPNLEINKIFIDKSNGFASLIIDASGTNMTYACYLYNDKTKAELVKTGYQLSNTFVFQLPPGEYFARVFVKANQSNSQKKVDTIKFKVK